jgi:hypothetical protein
LPRNPVLGEYIPLDILIAGGSYNPYRLFRAVASRYKLEMKRVEATKKMIPCSHRNSVSEDRVKPNQTKGMNHTTFWAEATDCKKNKLPVPVVMLK